MNGEELFKKNFPEYVTEKGMCLSPYWDLFSAGMEAGETKWHKVAAGDLPEAENYFWSRTVLLQTNKGSSIIGFYDHASKAWYEKATDDIVYGVVEWCEIPKYTEE